MKRKIKLLAGIIAVLSLTMVSLTGCVFLDGEGVWRSWGPNGDNQYFTGIDSNENGCFYFRDGVLDWGYNGMACNEYGWWHITNGVVDFNYTGMDCNEYGWWYFKDGQIDWNYTGFADNFFGTWLYQNGRMNFDYNGLYEDYLVENSRVKTEFTGVYDDLFIQNGKVNRTFTGDFEDYHFEDGKLIHIHDYEVEGYVPMTCLAAGYTGDKTCKTCGEYIKGEVIPVDRNAMAAHGTHLTYVEPVWEYEYTQPSCIIRCNHCGQEMDGNIYILYHECPGLMEAIARNGQIVAEDSTLVSDTPGSQKKTLVSGGYYECSECHTKIYPQ